MRLLIKKAVITIYMASGDFETTACLICSSKNEEQYSERGQFNLPTHVVICKKCGFTYLNPRWTIERYNKFYATEYDTYYRDEYIHEPKPEIVYHSIKGILDRIEKNKIDYSGFKNILDIGSGMGHSLMYLKNNVLKDSVYHAIEPSEFCMKHLQKNGIEVISNDVYAEWDRGLEKKFDFVIMRHVLEHFNSPLEVLHKVGRVLKDGGVLYLAVPNAYKPTRPLKTNYFRVVHVSYFSPVSYKNLLSMAGLSPFVFSDGDGHDPYELFAFIRKGSTNQPLEIESTNAIKQKEIFDAVGKNDFYYTQKTKLVRVLRRLKLIK